MDYRSRQRVPNEIGNQANNLAIANVPIETGSTSTASSAAELNEDLNNPLSSLQSTSQRTLSSYSSSQQAMIPNNSAQISSIYQHQAESNADQQRTSRQKNQTKMNQHHLQAQRNNQTSITQQQVAKHQRIPQQMSHQQNAQHATTQRFHANNGAAGSQIGTNARLVGPHMVGPNSASAYGTSSGLAPGAITKQHLKQQRHQHDKSGNKHPSLHNSSGDNLTTSSSSDQTIDDLQQLAHGYRLNSHAHASSSAIAKHVGKLSQYAYGGGGGAGIGLDEPLSPRLALTGSSLPGSTASSTSNSPSEHSGSRFLLGVLFTLAEILLFSVLLLWLYWAFQHDDGLAWQADRKQQFNTHAALMLLGFIFLNGQAMLIYRSFQCCTKIYTKILHTILFVLATSAIGLGLCLAYTAQENVGANNKPIMHFYSLHAWIGLSSISLFGLQFTVGFTSFLLLLCCDQATRKFREALLPVHKTFGLIIFSLAISTCLTGLLQTARSRLSSKLGKIDYHELAEPGIVINVIGGCLICLAILMPYIIRNLDIKRPAKQTRADRRLRLSEL